MLTIKYETTFNSTGSETITADVVAVSAKTENIDAVLAFIDALYEPVRSVEARYGAESIGCIEVIDENTINVLPPTDPEIPSGTWKWAQSLCDNAAGYVREGINLGFPEDEILAVSTREPYKEALAKYATPENLFKRQYCKYTTEEMEKLSLIETELSGHVMSYASKVGFGEVDLDETWDDYVAAAKEMGVDEATEIHTRAFGEFLKTIGAK